jgi:hypothetical protein
MAQIQSAQLVRYEPIRSLGYADIASTYSLVGTRFANPVRILKVVNLSDANLMISFDGVDDYDVVAAGGGYIYDYCSDRNALGGNFEQPANTQVYVKYIGSAPMENGVYVVVIYASAV